MRRKMVLVLIAILGIMVALMGIPSSAKRAGEMKDKAAQTRLQGLKPQTVQAVGFAKTKALRDMPRAQNRVADSSKINEGREINEKNEELERVQPPGAPRQSVDNAIRGGRSNSPSGGGVSVTPPPIGSFEGLADTDNGTVGLGLVNPPDTNADVGYTQIVETVNSMFRVYDKTGAPLSPVIKQSTLFAALGGICAAGDAGDPIVLYDRIADRWNISQFSFKGLTTPPYHQCIAVSQTNDAAGEYYLYDFELPGVEFPDYPKLGAWPDAYYMTSRQFTMGGPFNGVGAFAFNRQKMLAGDPTAELIYFSIPNDANYPSNSSSGMLPSDHDGLLPPPAGAPNVFAIYDSDEFGGTDSLRLFDFHADFVTPASSTFTERTESPLAVPAFDDRNPNGRADIEEPAGENLDSIGDRLMFRLEYRNRGGVESLVTNHTVNTSGVTPSTAATYQAASRYYELRKSMPGDPYAVYDAATYSPDAGNGATGTNRWMGSTNIDNQGNLAMGYSASSTAILPSILYVGREAGELGASLTNEQVLFPGQGTQAAGSGNRWGDYTSMSVDPTDDCTFWYANEYDPPGNTGFNWHTRIGDFKFSTCTAPPQGTLSGTITACDSGAPIGEAKVEVTGGPSDGFSSATADDGTYTLHLAPGTYMVTVSSGIRDCQMSASTMVTITDGGTATYSTCLSGIANLVLPFPSTVTVSASGGNSNSQIDKNECNTLNVPVENHGCAPARHVVGTLSTTTPGVTITNPTSAYPNIPIDGTASNKVPFGVSTSPSFVCGTPIEFTLMLTYTGGSNTLTFTLQTCQTPPQPFMGAIDPSDPATTNGRLGRNGVASSCAGKTCPGPLGSGPRSYDTFTFNNAGGVAACATIDLSTGADTCGTIILASAYLDSFDPSNLCTNYLGDAGASSQMQHFSVTVPAGHNLIVVVMAANNNTTTCPYTGTVSGLIGDIDGGGQCADLGVTKTDDPDPVLIGQNITYHIVATNHGPGDATGVVVTDYLPSSTTYISATPSQGSCAGTAIVTCNLGNLASGAMATIDIVAKAHGNPNTIYNRVRIKGNEPDGNQTNNEDLESTKVVGLRKLSFMPPIVTGGCEDSTGTILLTGPAPTGGVVVSLHSNNPHVHVPATVMIPQGMTSATFPATTDVVMGDVIVFVTATAGNQVGGRLKLLAVRITDMTFNPNPVHGGMNSIATITLSCAPDVPITVRLTSDRAAAMPPSSIVIPAGSSSGQATIHTLHVTSMRDATITAYANGGYIRRTLTIIP